VWEGAVGLAIMPLFFNNSRNQCAQLAQIRPHEFVGLVRHDGIEECQESELEVPCFEKSPISTAFSSYLSLKAPADIRPSSFDSAAITPVNPASFDALVSHHHREKTMKRALSAIASATVLVALTACAATEEKTAATVVSTPQPARTAAAPATPAQRELEKAIRESGLDQTVKSLMNEEMIGMLFGMMRAALNEKDGGKDAGIPPAFEKKMDQLAEELPKKLAPVIAKALDVAEQEMKRAVREEETSRTEKKSPRKDSK
jgi:hypothetical protein